MFNNKNVCLLLICLCSASATQTASSNATTTSLNKEPKVVGGQPIPIASARYQVSVRLKARERRVYGSGHICGGSVVSQRLVTTAAHCTMSGNPPKQRSAGEYILVMGSASLYIRDANTLSFDVQQIITHPKYNSSTLDNDIALMFINGYIPWQWPTVQAIQLQSKAQPAKTMCAVTGWGKTDDGSVAAQLMVGYVPIVSPLQCALTYGNLLSSMLCAGYVFGGVDACQGDSGGPLACDNLLTGIVSWGNGCGMLGYPGVYANATYLSNWIMYQNASFNYTHYGGGTVPITATSQLFVLMSAFMTIGLSFILSI